MSPKLQAPKREILRCAIYTRKSTEEGLEQEFNTLHAQREAGENYVKSQTSEGWMCLPEHYDDGGFSGGNMERPALQRLLADIEARKIDIVVVYKVDRLSRSLLDFARMVEIFDRHNIAFVSVTQLINTATSMGRLMLNVLLSFAQFEREIISERTRDKIAATRRKGKWSGGMPVLGYTVVDTKLVVDPLEADRVRQMFALYLEHRSTLRTVQELNRRGWTTKRWTTKQGRQIGGKPFTKGRLYQLLTNVVYLGQVRYKAEVHPGEHEAIVDQETFDAVQALLTQNGHGKSTARNKCGALLRNLLFCQHCQAAMGHTYTTKGKRRYRYYTCAKAQLEGRGVCPAPSLPAGEIEAFVVDQIKGVGRDPAILAATVAQVREQSTQALEHLEHEQAALERQRRADEAELRQSASAPVGFAQRAALLAEIQDRIGAAERRLAAITDELCKLREQQLSNQEIASQLAGFDQMWAALSPGEQVRVLELLIERIEYDGASGELSLTFRPAGLKALHQVKEHVA